LGQVYSFPPRFDRTGFFPCFDSSISRCEYLLARYSDDKASPVSPSNLTDEIENEILQAFSAIHLLGVIHGDIRADNILVGRNGQSVWIIDFEFAELVTGAADEMHSKIVQEIGAVRELLAKFKLPNRSCGNGSESVWLTTGSPGVHV
jgi:serine/threonine protein kinase